jgi:hypothetical protein
MGKPALSEGVVMTKPIVAVLCLATWTCAVADNSGIPQGTHHWGCEVLLCLANPAGPTAVFPTCPMATGPAGSSYASPGTTYYDHCPAGTSELPPGQLAQVYGPMSATPPATPSGMPSTYAAGSTDVTYAGIGSGEGYGDPTSETAPPSKVCVAGAHGSKVVWSGDGPLTVDLYDTVYVSPAQGSNRVVDIFIDNVWWQTVRW